MRVDGQPVSVPVWFLIRDDDTILLYSQADTAKLRNIADNPRISLTLDGTDIGRNIVRVEGTIRVDPDVAPADQQPAYLAKYLERIQALFGSSQRFADAFSTALVITATKLRV